MAFLSSDFLSLIAASRRRTVPFVSGVAYPGETLTSTDAGQWFVNGLPVGGPLATTLVVPEDAEGNIVYVNVLGTLSNLVTIGTLNGWVSTTGNDSAAGTYAAPWLTLARIVTFVQGATIATSLTLTATSGTGVTATAGSATFSAGDVGKSLHTTNGIGAAIITGYTSSTVVTVTVLSTFTTTAYASNTWAVAEMLDGATSRVRIKAGNYVNQSANITRYGSSASRTTRLNITSQSGVNVSWALGTDQSCFQGAGFNWTYDVSGYGGTISGFNVGTGNGIGATNTMTMIGRGWTITDCVDGISGHNDVRIEGYDLTISNCSKSAFQHINTVQSFHYRCSFTGKSGASAGIGQLDAGAVNYSEDCSYIPIANNQFLTLNGTYLRCKIGSLTVSTTAGAPQQTTFAFTCTDCFVNSSFDGLSSGLYNRCYGKVSIRLRGDPANPDLTFTNCVFVGGASGASNNFLYANTDSGTTWQGQGYVIRDCIFKGYSTVFGSGFTSNQFASFNAASTIANCCFNGNTTNIHASITIATGTLVANPLIGAANTLNKTDYGFTAGSPCIGAGTAGGDIGFPA